jgi:acetyl-CoA/propionyl-CoA carboxylase carboxyl transferase subunit
VRLGKLFDRASLRSISGRDDSGVMTARGQVDGTPAVAFATDATLMGGAVGVEGCRHIADAIDLAVRERIPVVGLWHCGGARLAEGVLALDGVGQVFAATVRASGRVPQISVVLGPAAGAAAYGPALTDIVVTSEAGRISDAVHVSTQDDDEALRTTRSLAALLGRQGRISVADAAGSHDLAALFPTDASRAYDVKPVVAALLDEPGIELQPTWAPNVVTTLGRFAGRAVGVIANNPLRLDGCLDASSAVKAARFVRMCDALGVPLIVLVDVPGHLSDVGQEWDSVVLPGAKLLHAFAETVVPRVTLITRKAFGAGYIAMNSRSLGATAVFAWPHAEIAVEEQAHVAGAVARAVEIGVVDAVITPADTRRRIAEALASAPAARGAHGNIPL